MSRTIDRISPPRRGRRILPRAPWVRIGALVAVIVVFGVACLSPVFLKDATQQDVLLGVTPPGEGHLLGTDELGRDVFSLLLAGATTSVLGALAIAIGSMLIGVLVGTPAGYFGGRIDQVAMRWTDLMFSIPALLVAIVVSGVMGGGYILAIGVLIILFSPGDTRVARGGALEQANKPYVEAARVLGLSSPRILGRHVWPNVAPLSLANAFLNFAFALVALASLSFLGLGVGPGSADWGRTLAESRTLLFDNPWAAIAPGLAIIITASAVNILGDWLSVRSSAGSKR